MENDAFNSFYFQLSKISLKIKFIGNKAILGNIIYDDHFGNINYLKKVYINGKLQDTIASEYYFDKEVNFVELIWNDNWKSCQNMFRFCEDITEIDLSSFDTSQVDEMSGMFCGCNSITSLNLSYFNTSKVTNRFNMFNGCNSLTSI